MLRSVVFLLASALAPSVALAQGKVWTVAPGGAGADFALVSSAVAAAADGDFVLVKAGSYADSFVVQRPITIQAERDAVVSVSHVEVSNLVSGSVQLRGLEIHGGLRLQGAAGLVWIEDCVVSWSSDAIDFVVEVRDCEDVVLVDTQVVASPTFVFNWFDERAQSALLTEASSVHAFGCTFVGADADLYDCPLPNECAQPAGDAIVTGASDFLYLGACHASGGAGATNESIGWDRDCSPGGTALASSGTSVVLGGSLAGGPGTWCSPAGPDRTGDVHFRPDRPIRLTVASPARESEEVVVDFRGPPLTPVYLISGPVPRAAYVPIASGILLVGPPRTVQLAGSTDGEGRLTIAFPQPALPPGIDAATTLLQAVYRDLDSALGPHLIGKIRREPTASVFGAGTVLVTLDDSF
jgi:hypothetical protein